ncbi:MAG: [FeFe] hydrogenase, group A [FCB group bacterium]|jgi:NADH-quinone oxidoreductase subunit G|nr:[FeFe] hydrogenase, group A [FCB group bacterium]
MEEQFVNIDGKPVLIEGEKNLLELIRKAGVDIPTFCYHSELSAYGACRLCIVDIEGMGIVTSCSTLPRGGMVVKTYTPEIRETRKMTVELLLADHDMRCPTCGKNGTCQLQALARRMGIRDIRFKPTRKPLPVDNSTFSLVRDPNRCVLCGDCVRVCAEIQGIGAIDFANRGAQVTVTPAFGKNLDEVDCVYCGQCARVCPTGAITPKSEVEAVWNDIHDAKKTVVAQIAPAVRVAVGEAFGLEPGTVATGKLVAALRAIGFDKVYDTSFTADLTIFEEAGEFLQRFASGEDMPQFTSCCPAWVKFAEQNCPDLLENLSSCKSPQQMFGALAKDVLPSDLNVEREQLSVVSIMPCTAKKYEAKLGKFERKGMPDVDHVLTTQELARMIVEAGIDFNLLEPDSLDMPFGFKTGAGVLFGASGGVSEAVLRYAVETVEGRKPASIDFHAVRGAAGIREATVELGGKPLRLAVVHGLANAKAVVEKVRSGESNYDFIEVMACPGGCINGAGQPVYSDSKVRDKRTAGIYAADKQLDVHCSQENPYIHRTYAEVLGEVGGDTAHRLLHTGYQNRRRLNHAEMALHQGEHTDRVNVTVCVGTSCHVKGAQKLLSKLIRYVGDKNWGQYVDIKATFCMEACDRGPTVNVAGIEINHCTMDKATEVLDAEVGKLLATVEVRAGKAGYVTLQDFEKQTAAGILRFLETLSQDKGCAGCQPGPNGCGCEH